MRGSQDQAVLVAACQKSPREEFRATLKSYNGERKIELAIFKRNGLGVFEPTPRRVVMVPALVRDVIEILEKAENAANDERLP